MLCKAREPDQIRSRPCAGGHARRHHRIGSAASGLPARALGHGSEAEFRDKETSIAECCVFHGGSFPMS
jgi:hypothetical protein